MYVRYLLYDNIYHFLTAQGEINANYHRVNVNDFGQQGEHTITANMNNFSVKVNNNNGDLVVKNVTDTIERPEVSKISRILVTLVLYFVYH